MTIMFNIVINMSCRMRVLLSFIIQISFTPLLTPSATLSFNNPSTDNWFSFLIKYSVVARDYEIIFLVVDGSNWRKIDAKAESENQSEIEDIRLVLILKKFK